MMILAHNHCRPSSRSVFACRSLGRGCIGRTTRCIGLRYNNVVTIIVMAIVILISFFLNHLLARQRWRCFDYNSLSGTFPAPSARLGVFESPDSSDRFAMDEEDEEDFEDDVEEEEEDLEDDGEEARS